MQLEFVGETMKVSELIKTAILSSTKQQKEVANHMGWSPQSFANRLNNDTIDADEWVEIASFLGYEIKMVASDGSNLGVRKRTTAPRVQQMIEGFSYDTEKSDAICRTPKMAGGSFELFKDCASGRFFIVIYCDWANKNGFITPVSDKDAEVFYKKCCGESAELFHSSF